MVIRSLSIRSYKSFLHQATIPLSPYFNVFIGPNNCGKTNVLDAIDFLAHPEKDPIRLHHYRTQIDLSLILNEKEQKRFGAGPEVRVSGQQYAVATADAAGKTLSQDIRQYLSSSVKVLQYEDFLDVAQIEKDYDSLAERYPERFVLLTRLLRENFPEVNAIDTIVDESSENFGTVSVGTRSITIERLGGGFRRVLVVLLYALHPEFPIVLIDEPEIHLHPGLIKKLLRVIESGHPNQLIVTSHSPLFITAYTLHEVYRVLKDEEGSHVYSLAQRPSSIDKHRLVQELNADNLEMFFADKVLLVEGVSDRILMRGLIDRFYEGSQDIKVIYTHGKSNIDIYIELMTIFHIPYVVMLDRDALPMLVEQFHLHAQNTHGSSGQASALEQLRSRHIYVLDNGSIEQNYPRHYQHQDSKPLNALYAAVTITPDEYRSPIMRNLRALIERL